MEHILFLLGFTIHNIEEIMLFPKWNTQNKKFSRNISVHQFKFAAIVITVIGYLLFAQYLFLYPKYNFSKILYLSFVAMMILNVVFPHLLATIITKKYAPGLASAILLNLPLGMYVLIKNTNIQKDISPLMITTIILSISIIILIQILIFIAKRIK